jgi:HEAT repeat protein
MIDALVFACNMDWDLAWNLLPEEDYLEAIVEHYDYMSHYIVPGGFFEKRRISGALFFIKLHEDVREVTAEGVTKKLARAVSPEPPRKRVRGTSLSKKEVEELVTTYQVDRILSVAGEDGKLIRNLQRLLYSGDDLSRQRAADVLGQVSAVVAETDPGTISKLLQRLFTAIDDTAAFTWGAFEAVGEIIRNKPELFAGYLPQLYRYLAHEAKRFQALQAVARIASTRPDLIGKVSAGFVSFLSDPDPKVRGNAARVLGTLKVSEAREGLEKLHEDTDRVQFYMDGRLEEKTVAQVASEALENM